MLSRFVRTLTAQRLIGVDVGSAVIKAVELSRDHGRLTLERCAVAPLGQGEVAGALKQLMSEAGMPAARVAVGIASPQVIVKPFALPPMPRKELNSAIRLEAEQAILNGHTMKDMAVDWHPLASSQKESFRGLLAVAPQATITARLEPMRAAGLRPVVIDVEGLALWNAYWALAGARDSTPKSVLLLNIGARTTNLVIAKGPDALVLMRDLQVGGAALEAGQHEEWMAEVRDSIGYARSQCGLRALDCTYVTGGGGVPQLVSAIETAVATPVTSWNPLRQLSRNAHSPSVEDAVGPLLAIAIGLALRQE